LNTVAKAYKELEIQNILETQQGTGTFINTGSYTLSENERKQKLRGIIRQFTTVLYSYGFTTEDIINELKNQKS
jgi:GntR family transcriptional regulator